MTLGGTGASDCPVDVAPVTPPGPHDVPPVTTRAATRPSRRPGLYIPYSAVQVLAVLTGSGVVGLLIALRWPQADAVIGTICAIIGAGQAVLDIMSRRRL